MSAVLKFPVAVKLAAQPPKLQCWKSYRSAVPPRGGRGRDLPALSGGTGLMISATETESRVHGLVGDVTLVPITEVTSVPFWKNGTGWVLVDPALAPIPGPSVVRRR
jgi:hypothetical protein